MKLSEFYYQRNYEELLDLIALKNSKKKPKKVKTTKPTVSMNTWKAYQKEVRRLTKLQPVDCLEGASLPRCTHFSHFNSTSHFVIDHKISIWWCFNNNVPASLASNISNLRWISANENRIKNVQNFLDSKNLFIYSNYVNTK